MGSDIPSGDSIFTDDAEDAGTRQPPASLGETEKKVSGGRDARKQRKVVYPDPVPDGGGREPQTKRPGARDAKAKTDIKPT